MGVESNLPAFRHYSKENNMSNQCDTDNRPCFAVVQYQPKPNVLYNLDAAAHIAGVPRRSILMYYRAGLVRSVFQQPYGVMSFTDEAIHAVRRIEQVRIVHRPDLPLLKTLCNLYEEVESLRAELRFLRLQ
jgi:hypothetical protein